MEQRMVELRCQTPKDTIDVIDAYSLSRGISRTDYVNEILGEWVRRRLHETNLVVSIAKGNPTLSEAIGLERK